MLTFLRKIRRALIESGSAQKYLLYAIGEIALVVAGILIALQINNWNEWRKDRIDEQKILTEIKNALEADMQMIINQYLPDVNKRESHFKAILMHIDHRLPYDDSLDGKNWVLTRSRGFNPNLTAYTGLEAMGIDIIQNEEIKNSIINVYNSEYRQVEKSVENHLRNIYDYGRPMIRTHFRTEVYEDSNYAGTIYRPIDFNQLARNPEYRNALIVLKQDNLRYGRLLNSAVDKVEELIAWISAYIK